jgi:hypothetical protein
MNEVMTWAATPEAKAKLAEGHRPPEKKKWPCPAMQNAQARAEAATKKPEETEAAVGGNDISDAEEKKK